MVQLVQNSGKQKTGAHYHRARVLFSMVWEWPDVSCSIPALLTPSTNLLALSSYCMSSVLHQVYGNNNFTPDLNKVFNAIGSEKNIFAAS